MFALRYAALVRPAAATILRSVATQPLRSMAIPGVAVPSDVPVRLSSTATSFRMKKQKEWRIREARGFKAMKTHSGCKKRFRFFSKFGVVCKHSGKYHKNYNKHHSRLARLRKMKLVPRHLVKRLKIMMPYWKRQMRKEQQLMRLATEQSVNTTSDISLQRQRVFIEAQRERLSLQLLHPKPYFPRVDPASARANA